GVLRTEDEVQRMVDAAVAAALAGRGPISQGGSGVPGIEQPVFDEEWAAAAAVSRKRRAVRQPSGSDGEDSESEEKKRAAAKARFGSLRTATDEELRRALDGSLAVKDITRPPEGEIGVEPEEERADGVTMASGDQEPEPAGEACEMQVPLMSERAHLLAEALKDWPDVAFLVRAEAQEMMDLMIEFVTMLGFKDLKVVERVIRLYNGRKVVLHKEDVHEDAFATDASLRKGMGGHCQPDYFLVSWEDLAEMPQRDFYPFTSKAKSHINYLELFADRDDWQFSPVLFAEMDEEFGPFALDACVASSRANAFCVRNWSAEDDARKQRFDGLNTWANLPFSVMYEILLNFLKCKRRQQMGTGGCFLVPVWEGDEAYELVSGMREVFRPVRKYRAGTMLFTAPALDGKGRSEWGPTRWDVLVDGAYAESTQRSYDTGVKAFLTFCVRFACLGTLEPLLPASDATLARFIAFSAWFVQPGTIKSYLAGVRSLHLQQGVEWTPVAHRFWVAAALQGVRRRWDRPAKPVMPITLRDLARMAEFADMESITGLALWAAILVGFYRLFRKDNLTVGKSQAWNARGALVREDVLFAEAGDVVWIRVRHSKTIQCGERYHWVPLVAVPGSRLCPVEALRRLMLATEGLPEEAPLFQVEGRGKRGALVPMAHAALVAGLKSLAVQVGLDPARYAGHSLRRGGATAAMRLNVEKLYIKLQGDWKSDCWERYCELDDEQRLILPAAFAEAAKELS
ncbi:hypothetical protein CYMTET_33022, partial [Cymbomonas tetramitiformis]